MVLMSAEEYAADAMKKKADALRRSDRTAVRAAEVQLEVACKAIRSRSADWMPPTDTKGR